MPWYRDFGKVRPYIVRIETPQGLGTGFFFAYNDTKRFAAFATAAHVVDHAHQWKLPIKVRHHDTGKEVFLGDKDRFIVLDKPRDTASVVFANPGFLPAEPLRMMDSTKYRSIGTAVAWAGYPAIADPHLCLFTGTIAAFVSDGDSYLIDGVAINGVSGGPVFASQAKGVVELIGSVSAYISNWQRGETLPGLLRAQDLTPLQTTIKALHSIDEARAKQVEEQQQGREREAAAETAELSDTDPDA
jgi:hypothetical protein